MNIRLHIDIETNEESRALLAERVVAQPVVYISLPGFGEFSGRFTGASQVDPKDN